MRLKTVNGFCSRIGVSHHPCVLPYSNICIPYSKASSNMPNITFQPLATLLAENASFPMRGRERCCKGLGPCPRPHGQVMAIDCHSQVTITIMRQSLWIVCICLSTFVCMYVCMHACMHVCMPLFVYLIVIFTIIYIRHAFTSFEPCAHLFALRHRLCTFYHCLHLLL